MRMLDSVFHMCFVLGSNASIARRIVVLHCVNIIAKILSI